MLKWSQKRQRNTAVIETRLTDYRLAAHLFDKGRNMVEPGWWKGSQRSNVLQVDKLINPKISFNKSPCFAVRKRSTDDSLESKFLRLVFSLVSLTLLQDHNITTFFWKFSAVSYIFSINRNSP